MMKDSIYFFAVMSILPVIMVSAAKNHQEKQPNIILIYCDDLGYGDLGVTGHPAIRR